MKSRISTICLILSVLILLATHFFYFPKWEKKESEATISWDVSGYYMYLPAIFIYKDLKKCAFKDDILQKYKPTPDFQQAFKHENSGNFVMKYSIGQAIVFSPFFAVAHLWASSSSKYPPDGFSFPYQFLISIGSLIIAIIGLIYLRKALLVYFKDTVVGLCLIGITFGTNYLNYAAIDGAMTHNTLFTIYALLIWQSIQFYKNPTLLKSIGIGLCVGFAALIRPTEIISAIIPILWGLNLLKIASIKDRITYILSHWKLYALSVIATILVGTIQLFYWKYVSGEWIVYSYQDQGFSWLTPHLMDGIFSYKSGWLIYSPLLFFALLGFFPLFKVKHLFPAIFIHFLLFTYIAFAWDIWWYGGSLGQRTMVQLYPILAFPLCAFIDKTAQLSKFFKALSILFAAVFIYANLWFTHHAHKGGLLHVGQMTGPYFWKTIFRNEKKSEDLKLLDGVSQLYEGQLLDKKTIFTDVSFLANLDSENQYSPSTQVDFNETTKAYDWIRVSADIKIGLKEWNFWTMAQFIVNIKHHDEVIDSKMIRLQRHLWDNESKNMFIDFPMPDQAFTALEIKFWNGKGHKPITISNLAVDVFNEE